MRATIAPVAAMRSWRSGYVILPGRKKYENSLAAATLRADGHLCARLLVVHCNLRTRVRLDDHRRVLPRLPAPR